MCKIWFVSHPIEKFRNERSAAMNIAVAAITLNIFSPFILFYFFALAAVALVSAVQVAASLEPLPWWPPAQEPRFLQG